MWDDVDVTAVEIDPQRAAYYASRFLQDRMIVGDAREYLLNHHNEYDFIWASPPCKSHSRANMRPHFPDFELYELIVFCQVHVSCKWIIENVVPWYKPPIPPTSGRGRHFLWSNFHIPRSMSLNSCVGLPLEEKQREERDKVEPEIGKFILECAWSQQKLKCQ